MKNGNLNSTRLLFLSDLCKFYFPFEEEIFFLKIQNFSAKGTFFMSKNYSKNDLLELFKRNFI